MTTVDQQSLLSRTATFLARVTVGASGRALAAATVRNLVRVVVDTQVSLPDMFELTFSAAGGDPLAGAGVALGTPVQVFGPSVDGTAEHRLINGEVTAIEGDFSETGAYVTVRGYTLDHRLHRVRRTRTFVGRKDSDIARQVASAAKLKPGTIDPSEVQLPHLTQAAQTDWEFLAARARAIGYEVGADGDKFYFRKSVPAGRGTPIPLRLGGNLRRFQPRVTAGNLTPEVEVRAWDPVAATAVASRAATVAPGVKLGGSTPASTAGGFVPAGAAAAKPAPGSVGPAAGQRGQIVPDRAFGLPGGSDGELAQAAAGLAAALGGSFAEAQGEMLGDARVLSGAAVRIQGIPAPFAGVWTVTGARHVFDIGLDGYRTHLTAAGTQDRSLFGLAASGPRSGADPARIDGVVCGVVSNTKDPENLGRVKLALPWLSTDYESDWAPVGQLFAGETAGAFFVPSPGDQVLVAFEFGDVRRPYVLGSLPSKRTGYGLDGGQAASTRPGGTGLKTVGETSAVVRRGMITPAGSRLVFHDDVPAGGKGRPTAAGVLLGTKGDQLSLAFDQVAGTVTLRCAPERPGKLVIECTGQTAMEIKAGSDGSLTVDGGASLKLTGKTVDISGNQINISGTAATVVKGKPVQIN